ALDLAKASYPPSIVATLRALDYRIDVDTQKAKAGAEVLLADIHAALAARAKVMAHFWEQEDWDLYLAVITETDRLQHFLWSSYADPSSPHHDAVLNVYREVDRVLGEM